MGASIGKRVFMNNNISAEGFDLITIGDDVTINIETEIKCSVVEDRVLILRRVTIEAECTIGTRSVVEAGVVMHRGSQAGNMTLLPLGMRVNAGEIWRGSPCKLVGIVNEDEPDSFSQIKTPQQGTQGTPPAASSNAANDQVSAVADLSTDLSTGLLLRRPIKAVYDNYPDNALGAGYSGSGGSSAAVSARHVVPVLLDGGVNGGVNGGVAVTQQTGGESGESKGVGASASLASSASSASSAPAARVPQNSRQRRKRRKRGKRLFGCCAGVWQALAIAFISTIDIICFMPTTELYLYSVKASPGSLLGALFGLEPIVAERICGGEKDIATGAKLTPITGNGTEFECKLPFAITRKDQYGAVVGFTNYTSCTVAACGNIQQQQEGVYRCCSAEAVLTELNWLECTSCPNTGARFKADGLQYLNFVVILETCAFALLSYPILYTAALIICTRLLSVGLDGHRHYPVNSWKYYRRWLNDAMIDHASLFTKAWQGTMFLPTWMWLLGADIKGQVEISSSKSVEPAALRMENGSFIADSAVLGTAVVRDGMVTTGTVTFCRRSFIGNGSFAPCGSLLREGMLVGLQSEVPRDGNVANSTWLGAPAISLTAREGAGKHMTQSMTYAPSCCRRFARAMFELGGYIYLILAQSVCVAVAIWLFELAYEEIVGEMNRRVGQAYKGGRYGGHYEGARTFAFALLIPLIHTASGVLACVITILTKWVVIGRFKEGDFPLWSLWVWRTELVERMEENLAEPSLLSTLHGTIWVSVFYRCMGARIGSRAYITRAVLTEPDLITIGNSCTLEGGGTLQAHLFQDRVRHCGAVSIGDHCSIGTNSVVLAGGSMGDKSTLNALSMAMRSEEIPASTHWMGIPAQRAALSMLDTGESVLGQDMIRRQRLHLNAVIEQDRRHEE